jgi:hypothetical protein
VSRDVLRILVAAGVGLAVAALVVTAAHFLLPPMP